MRGGIRERTTLAHRLADPAPHQKLDSASSGGSRFYASVCDAAVARSILAKKERARYWAGLAQIKEADRDTLWQNTWIVVGLALLPIFLLIGSLVLVFALDVRVWPPATLQTLQHAKL